MARFSPLLLVSIDKSNNWTVGANSMVKGVGVVLAVLISSLHGWLQAIREQLTSIYNIRLQPRSHRASVSRKTNVMKISSYHNRGFTLVEIMIVVAIIGLLAAIALPNFVRAREAANLNSIINNLRLIEGAKDQWALEYKKTTGASVASTSLTPYMRGGRWITKFANESYSINGVGTLATASFNSLAGKTGASSDGTTTP